MANKIIFFLIDHPQHGTNILGGMWGFKSSDDRKLANDIITKIKNKNISEKYNFNSRKGLDQHFLRNEIYALIKGKSIIHDSYLCTRFKDSEPFPSKRKGNCFVGRVGPCNESDNSFFKCPLECRLNNHSDWLKC